MGASSSGSTLPVYLMSVSLPGHLKAAKAGMRLSVAVGGL